jgi:hypothetical protein
MQVQDTIQVTQQEIAQYFATRRAVYLVQTNDANE